MDVKAEDIYSEYADIVFRYLMCLCHDPDLAEELTQETFCRAIQASFQVRENCRVSTWLCQIAKHVWCQELDRRRRHEHQPLDEKLASGEDSPEELVIRREEKMELFRKVHALKELEKEVVLLRITGAFAFREIGELFGRSENWARVTFYRAKQKLVSGSGGKEKKDEV